MMRTRNFRAWNEGVESGAATKKRREKSAWRGKWDNAISGKQQDNVRNETHAVSVMMEHLGTAAIRDKSGQSSSLAPKAQTQTDGKKPSKGSGVRQESPSGTGGRVACRSDERFRDLPEWLEEFTDKSGGYRSACICTHFS